MKYLLIALSLLPSAAGAVEPWRPTPPDPIEMPVNCYGQLMSADACQQQHKAWLDAILNQPAPGPHWREQQLQQQIDDLDRRLRAVE